MNTEDDEEDDVGVPVEELWSESHYEFPFFDEGTAKSSRANARTKYGRVFPDGYFTVKYVGGLSCRYLLEVETQSRARKLIQKIDGYGSYLRRRLKEDPERMDKWLSPVVCIFRTNSTRDTAVANVSTALEEGVPELERYSAWTWAARNRGFEAGCLILFASLEDLREYDSLGTRYRALDKYPEGSSTVSLETAAREVARVTK